MEILKVLNIEPENFSVEAQKIWSQFANYSTTTWETISGNKSNYIDTNILIIRLKKYLNADVLSLFPNLKFVISATTGHDHIDINELSKRKIQLISLRDETEFLKTIPSTAEHTWGLVLSILRNIPASNQSVKEGNWNRMQFKGYELKGKNLGIVGMGRLGKMVAMFGKAFGMNVSYYDPFVDDGDCGKSGSLSELMECADVITLHVHADDTTHHLINEENLSKLKKGAVLVNTSRGMIVDENAVIKYLKNNKLLGYATDVLHYENENFMKSVIWKNHSKYNIIITPHIGGATWDAMWACEKHLAKVAQKIIVENRGF